MNLVRLAGPADTAGWRREARRLLIAGVAPEAVDWQVATDGQEALFAEPEGAARDQAGGLNAEAQAEADAAIGAATLEDADVATGGGPHARGDAELGNEGGPRVRGDADMRSSGGSRVRGETDMGADEGPRVPSGFLELARLALLHRDPRRHALLYRLLWRLVHEPGLRADPLDADRTEARALAQSVKRDLHKMKAFVRFNERRAGDETAWVAWFEPEHHIVDAVAPFFVRRFTGMRWAIFTPERSIAWDGRHLEAGRGARREDIVRPDAGEALWLTYYQHIFNPARLKLQAMQGHMPRKYWHNLPEAALIAPLAADATRRMEEMVEQPATAPRRGRRTIPVAAPGESLHEAATHCFVCPHAAHATQVVWGEGPSHPRVVLVGEQPGDQEDLQGRPFVGPAGALLDETLAQIGVDRRRVYLTNAVKHFRFELRGKRRMHKTPGQQEILACQQWLERELDELKPKALVALGATAAQAVMGEKLTLREHRGRWLERADGMPVLVTWHPAALLRMPREDLDAARAQWAEDLSAIAPIVNEGAEPA